MSDEEELDLVHRVREGDDSALPLLRAFWLRRTAIGDAFAAVELVEGLPLREAGVRGALSIVTGRVALAWSGSRWEVVAFDRDDLVTEIESEAF